MGIYNVGDKIGANFLVRKIIGGEGKSGMGIVYVCYRSEWDKIIALKTFQNRYFSSTDIVDSFRQEALAWISLEEHPFIVKALTVENFFGQPFIMMEYIPPDDLGRN